MKTFLTPFLFLLIPLMSLAQKKPFFQHVDIGLSAFAEDVQLAKEDWKNLYANRSRNFPYNLDDFDEELRRGYYFGIKGGFGLLARVSRTLTDKWSSGLHHQLEWRTGLQFRSFNGSNEGYHDYPYLQDTTKIYTEQSVVFRSKRSVLDLTNGLIYKFSGSRSGWYFFYIGGEVSLGMDLQSSVREKYYAWQYKWQSASYRWVQTPTVSTSSTEPAKKFKTFAWSIPAGIEVKMNNKVRVLCELAYISEHQHPRFARLGYTSGLGGNLVFRFNL